MAQSEVVVVAEWWTALARTDPQLVTDLAGRVYNVSGQPVPDDAPRPYLFFQEAGGEERYALGGRKTHYSGEWFVQVVDEPGQLLRADAIYSRFHNLVNLQGATTPSGRVLWCRRRHLDSSAPEAGAGTAESRVGGRYWVAARAD